MESNWNDLKRVRKRNNKNTEELFYVKKEGKKKK